MRSRTRSLQSKKYIRKKQKRTLLKTVLVVLGVVAICAAVVFFLRMDRLQIHEVQIAGNRSVDSAEVKAIADTHLNTYSLWFIPNHSYFTYPSDDIAAEIVQKFPRVASVQLVRHKDILSVTINERVPSAIVCAAQVSASDSCLFADDTAFLYSEAPYQSSNIYLEFKLPATNAPGTATTSSKIGTTFMDVKQFQALRGFVDGVAKLGFPVTELEIEPTGDLRVYTKSNTDILIRYAESYDSTLNNLALFLEKLKQQSRASKKPLNMSSIDLRYGNSVFFKSEGTTTASPSSTTTENATAN